jgi:hypothetical protein
VLHDFQVDIVGKGCSIIATTESINVLWRLHVILDLNGIICSYLEKNILINIGNAVFLKSWKHTVKNSSTNAYLSRELGPWLEKLHKEGKGQVPEYVNNDQLGVNPLVPRDTLYDYIMEELQKVVKL